MSVNKWCEDDEHSGYQLRQTFNAWLDSDDDEAVAVLKTLGIGRIVAAPSKALFAGDRVAYHEELERFQTRRLDSALGQDRIDDHWVGKNRAHFNALLEPLTARHVIPFVGAGISCASSLPSWTAHVLHQAKSAGLDTNATAARLGNGEYEAVVDDIVALRGEGLFAQEMRDAFDGATSNLQLAKMVVQLTRSVIVTTNYDRVLEQALSAIGEASVELLTAGEENARLIRAQSNGQRALLKVHGDIRLPTTWILSAKQYDANYGLGIPDMKLPLPRKLRHIFEHGSILFLGCSLVGDRTLRVFENLVAEAGLANVPRHFAILEAPKSPVDLVAHNARLANLSIDVIWYPNGAHEYVQLLISELLERIV
ncbi:SIR2 family NAD-dependent protein deacylase [Burkholderia sp. WAC0059]|uniref:SIR2 family NAD-dependent protein deacylase n=1 Tax=Burkholderia sp. WAC0059 TaxID=2066022 RepID=UPI0011AEC76D|nr:SIR2 family protein [Burkholderia sp. WAC0059]